jgi:Right handed beta helix region
MKRVTLAAVVVVLAVTFTATTAHAQATRTWVSGVGDDVNPCSRTAPCRTFAGAISKTAAHGEISALDPGGFGAVTITKSITINGVGTLAGILGATVHGVIINALATDVVVLRDLQINGIGTGLDGIRVLSAGTDVIVDNVIVQGFDKGIHTGPLATGNVTVANSTITDSRGVGVHAEAGTISVLGSRLMTNNIAVQADLSATIRLSNNDVMNNNTGFACGTGGVLASASNNRTAGNAGGVVPVCNPNAAITVR